MKKGILIFAALAMSTCCLLSACGGEKKDPVSVYVVETDSLYTSALDSYEKEHPDMLDVKSFDSYESMNEQLNTELMSGKGPDLLLFNSRYSTSDIYKLANGGAFLSLDDFVKALSDTDYYTALLPAGKIKDAQYVLPLSWNIMQAYTSEKFLEESGYSDEESLYQVITAESERLADSDDMAATSLQFGRDDAFNLFLEIADVPIVDTGKNIFVANKEQVQEVAEFVKVFYDNLPKIGEIGQRYRNDFSGAVTHFSFLVENYPFLNNLRYYQSVYPNISGEEMAVSYFGRNDDENSLSAQVMHYGAISASADDPDAAWDILKYIMQSEFSMDFSKYDESKLYYAPVAPESYEKCVVQLETKPGQGPKKAVSPLNEQNAAQMREIPGKLGSARIRNLALGEIVQKCMDPYLTGADSFDNCYAALESQVSLYLDE